MILINNKNKNHFLRMCRASALRRIKGSHTFDCVAGMICTIHEEFDIDVSKVVRTVTNNASKFKKALECYTTCKDSDEKEDDVSEEPVTVVDVSDIINTEKTKNL